MINACAWKPKVKGKDGKYYDSKLFNSLLSAFPEDRNSVKKHYFIANHPEFIEAFKEDLVFDEFDEVTFDSYSKATDLNIEEEEFLKRLNTFYKTGEYPIDEAINKIQEFNKNSEFSNKYIMMMYYTDSNKAKIVVESRTEDKELMLIDAIKNRNLIARMIKLLNDKGVGVSFLDGTSEFKGRYSTKNAKQAYDGLYYLISIFNGNTVSEVLAEEAGHFMFASMRTDDLMLRLYDYLTPEILNKLGISIDLVTSEEKKAEIIGRLLGQALVKNDTLLKSIINRLFVKAKKLYYKVTLHEVKVIELEAENLATKAVRNFISANSTASLTKALSIEETLYSKSTNKELAAFEQVQRELELMVRNMQTVNSYVHTTYKRRLQLVLSQPLGAIRNTDSALYKSYYAALGIQDILITLINDYQTIRERLNEIDLENNKINYLHINTIMEARRFLDCCNSILPFVEKKLSDPEMFKTDETIRKSLNKAYQDLKSLINSSSYGNTEYKDFKSLKLAIEDLEMDAYCLYLSTYFGQDYVTRAKRVVLDKFRIKRLTGPNGEDTWQEKLKDVLKNEYTTLFEEGTSLGYFFNSFSNIKDPTMSIFNNIVRYGKKQTNKEVLYYQKGLLSLYDDLYEIHKNNPLVDRIKNPVDPAIYYEKDSEGKFTGNIMQNVHWGKWEKDLSDFTKKCRKQFKEQYENYPEEINTVYKRQQAWKSFYHAKLVEWHKLHSIETVVDKHITYSPAMGMPKILDDGTIIDKTIDYTNKDYDKLSAKEKIWIESYIDLKKNIDEHLGNSKHTRFYRLPQFRGQLTERLTTVLEQEDSKIKKGIKTIGEVLIEQFSITSEDPEYGSDLYNTEDNENFEPREFEGQDDYGNTLNRLPLYGINKLKEVAYVILDENGEELTKVATEKEAKEFIKDHSELSYKKVLTENLKNISRDLFHSTLLYANMACNYRNMRDTSKIADLASDLYKSRQATSDDNKTANALQRIWKAAKDYTTSYRRFERFKEKSIYGVYNKQTLGKISLNKIITNLSQIASGLFLGGNITVGVKDFIGKIDGLYREAKLEEYVAKKSMIKGADYFVKHMLPHMWNFANETGEDPLTLFASYFNVSDKFESEIRAFYPTKSRWRKNTESSIWAPMIASGSVEIISYLAVAFDTKVRDVKTGRIVSLMDVYKSDMYANSNRKILNQKSVILHDLSDEALYNYKIIESILTKVEPYLELSNEEQRAKTFEFFSSLNTEEVDFLESQYPNKEFNIYSLSTTLSSLKRSMEFSSLEENKYVENKALLMINRIGGIYNMQDRTAFQDTALGAAAMSMRGYFNGIVAEGMLSSDRYNITTRSDFEGSLVTLFKAILDFSNFKNFKNSNFKKHKAILGALLDSLLIGSKHKEAFMDIGYSEHQYNNLKRQGHNVRALLTLYVLQLMFLSLAKLCLSKGQGDSDDEDDDDKLYMFLYKLFGIFGYLTKATFKEFKGIYNPITAMQNAFNMTSINGFTPIAGVIKILELAGLGILEIADFIDKIIFPDDDWDFLLAKTESKITEENPKGIRYRKDEDGNLIPIRKSEYIQSDKSRGIETGSSKFREKASKLIPVIRHADVLRDPLRAAEDLDYWDKHKK